MKESKLSYIAFAISVGAASLCGVSSMLSVFPNSSKLDTLSQQVHDLTEQNARLITLVAESRIRTNELDVGMTALANVLKIDRGELSRAFAAVKAGQEEDAKAAASQRKASDDAQRSANERSDQQPTVESASPQRQSDADAQDSAAKHGLVGSGGGSTKSVPTQESARVVAEPAKQQAPLLGADNPFSAGFESANAGGEGAPALSVAPAAPAKAERLTIAQVDAVLGKRLSTSWYKPEGATDDLSTIIQLKMSRDGTVAKVRVGKSSGNNAFDTSALSAVQALGAIDEVRQLSDADFQKAYASRNIQFTPQMGR